MKYIEIKKGVFAAKDFSIIVEAINPSMNCGNNLRIRDISGHITDIPNNLDWFLDNFVDELRLLNGKRVKVYRDEK